LILALVFGASLASFNNYLFPYLKELGAGESLMGVVLLVGSITEIPVMFFGDKFIRWLKSSRLLIFSMLMSGLRLLLFGVARTPGAVLVIQLLNGLTFPIVQVAGVSYADENSPPGYKATAQGLFGAMVFGIGSALGGFCGGLILEASGGRKLYLIFGLASLILVFMVALLQWYFSNQAEA